MKKFPKILLLVCVCIILLFVKINYISLDAPAYSVSTGQLVEPVNFRLLRVRIFYSDLVLGHVSLSDQKIWPDKSGAISVRAPKGLDPNWGIDVIYWKDGDVAASILSLRFDPEQGSAHGKIAGQEVYISNQAPFEPKG